MLLYCNYFGRTRTILPCSITIQFCESWRHINCMLTCVLICASEFSFYAFAHTNNAPFASVSSFIPLCFYIVLILLQFSKKMLLCLHLIRTTMGSVHMPSILLYFASKCHFLCCSHTHLFHSNSPNIPLLLCFQVPTKPVIGYCFGKLMYATCFSAGVDNGLLFYS